VSRPAVGPATDAAAARGGLLRELLRTVSQGNAFYQRKFRASGLTETDVDLDVFLSSFPFTTKAELIEDQRRHPPYGTNLSFPIGRYTRYWQTSGTSTAPIRWLDTPESWEWMLGSWAYMFQAMGVGAQDRVLAAFSFGPFLGFWTAFECAQRLGCLCVPGGGMSSQARLRALADNEVSVLLCTPTYALRLGEVASKDGGVPAAPSVRRIIVAGEPGGSIPATRERLADLWPHATVLDHYGMTETGPVAYQRPDEPGTLRAIGTAYIAEIIDPETSCPAEEGEVGELVLTSLGRLGSPLLRYRTGDLVRCGPAAGRCTERTLPGGVVGRADDMVVVRGVNVYPSAVESVLRRFPQVIEFRVVHLTSGATPGLRVEVELDSGETDVAGKVTEIGDALRTGLSIHVSVIPVGPGSLPRFEMKASRWTRSPG